MSLHPAVERIGREFRVLGASTPAALARKCELLIPPGESEASVAFVVADAIRCSSTLVTAFAAGARAITVVTKRRAERLRPGAIRTAARLGLDSVDGGELDGQPVPGGVIGNSPREVDSAALAGRHVFFQSTNFGAAYEVVTSHARRLRAAGARVEVFVASFRNLRAVASAVRAGGFERVVIGCGGFYDCISLEDLVLGGDLVRELGHDYDQLDDEARTMLGVAAALRPEEQRLVAFSTNWIGSCLEHFGMAGDVGAVVTGCGIEEQLADRSRFIVPKVRWLGEAPVLEPAADPSAAPQSQPQQPINRRRQDHDAIYEEAG